MQDPRDVISRPIVSEKSYSLIEETNTYTFEVDPRSNKEEIRDAVETVFEVKVIRVNTMNRRGKLKRQGWTTGRRNNTKRELVTLAASRMPPAI